MLDGARESLSPSDSPVSGIGGPADTFVMKGLSVVFAESGAQEAEFLLDDVAVLDDSRSSRGTGLPLRIPSLLGRKFMEDNGFTLHWDFTRRIAHIDIAEPCSGHGWRPRGCTSP